MQVYSSEESDMLIMVNSDIVLGDEKTEGEKNRAPTLRWDYLHVVVPGLVLVQTIKKARRGPNPAAQLGNGQCGVSVVYVIM